MLSLNQDDVSSDILFLSTKHSTLLRTFADSIENTYLQLYKLTANIERKLMTIFLSFTHFSAI